MSDEKPIDLREEWDDDREDYRTDRRWMERIPVDDLAPQTIGIVTDLPLQTEDGAMQGTIRGAELTQTEDEVKQAWRRKQEREPCWMCCYFGRIRLTTEQKIVALQAWLKKTGRWREKDALSGRLGEVENFEYCDVDKTLAHKDASCPSNWRRRDDL